MTSKVPEILSQQWHRRAKYVQAGKLEAWRLYDRENPALPFAIDIYKDNAVIHLFAKVSAQMLQDIEGSLQWLQKTKSFFYKNRTKDEMKLPVAPHRTIVVEEDGKKFQINLSDYLDTGLFLDHRETRKWIGAQSRNKVVLNTFAYSGSFSVYAAAAGAAKTYSVDLSKTYCEWIKKNLELNDLSLDTNWVYKMDTLEFFAYAKRKKMMFDIIVIDPPTFSRNKGKSFSVQTHHPELINAALELLNPDGLILFSNNKQDFRLDRAKLLPCRIENFQKQTIPPDFSNPLTHYCFVIRPA